MPLRSPLFPYTTLFRSRSPVSDVITHSTAEQHGILQYEADLTAQPLDLEVAQVNSIDQDSPRSRIVEDRKSTRLNSSHLGISYAVFCLKKKRAATTTSL